MIIILLYFYKVKNANRFINIYFDRYLSGVMEHKVERDYLYTLSRADLQALANKDEWIAHASLEEKLMLLSRLGHPFALVIGTPQKSPPKPTLIKIVTLFFKCLSWKRHDAVRVMRERFFFILSDFDFIKGLKLASHVLNSPASATLAGYQKVGEIFNYKTILQKQHMGDIAAGHSIDAIIISAMNLSLLSSLQEAFKKQFGITDRQYLVMALLSKRRELSLSDISFLGGNLRYITTHTKGLIEMRMVEKKLVVAQNNKNEEHYWLTGLGEQTLINARNFFIQHL